MVSTTSPARGLTDRLIARIRRMRDALTGLVASLGPDELHWVPEEGIPSIAEHLGHLARCDEACRQHLAGDGPPGLPAWKPQPPQDLSAHLADLARERAWLEECLQDRTGADASVHEALEDLLIRESHHRALILSLLRLMDPRRELPPLF